LPPGIILRSVEVHQDPGSVEIDKLNPAGRVADNRVEPFLRTEIADLGQQTPAEQDWVPLAPGVAGDQNIG
jgi:hypothetical protein